ncbi:MULTISPECIES: alginate export family protein [Sphingomonas]|jgi:hypothetical protein|uniref:alginate export family protein n=1 Tax=Sphingomonas TaxID=13687 RepID=UPI001AE5AFD8
MTCTAPQDHPDRTYRSRRSGIGGWANACAWSVGCGAALLLVCAPAIAQTTDTSRAPTLTIERYDEDWSFLADPERRSGRWTEVAKYIPLDSTGSTYLTTGLEARSRYEGYQNTNWGSSPDQGYVWHRLMPYADLHVGKFRVFAQPIVSAISGAEGPKRPVDTTGVDITQAFGEVEVDLTKTVALRVAVGRRLISLGAGRFIDTRYGPGVPLPFDGVQTTLSGARAQITLLYVRPVATQTGNFNDRTESDRAAWGGYATRWFGAKRAAGIDLYYLGYRDRHAVADQGMGREIAHTFGTRFFGDTEKWYWNVEGVVQRGTFLRGSVRAWGAGGEIGRRFVTLPLKPELALTSDVVSGDRNPDDPVLGTLNPMFPRGKYFGALTPVGPRNLIHVRPSTTVHPSRNVALSLTGVAYWRESTQDGIYNIPGFLVRSGRDSTARFIGKQIEVAVAWQATHELNLSAQLSTFAPGAFIRETGPAKMIRMAGTAATFRF